MLVNQAGPNAATVSREAQAAARALGRKILVMKAGSDAEIEAAFPMLAELQAGGLERVGVELNRGGFPNRAKHDSSWLPGGGRPGWRMERLFAFE
jgi:hypothetical protein